MKKHRESRMNFEFVRQIIHGKLSQLYLNFFFGFYLHELVPIRMTWEIFRQKVYVLFVLAASESQFIANSDGG